MEDLLVAVRYLDLALGLVPDLVLDSGLEDLDSDPEDPEDQVDQEEEDLAAPVEVDQEEEDPKAPEEVDQEDQEGLDLSSFNPHLFQK